MVGQFPALCVFAFCLMVLQSLEAHAWVSLLVSEGRWQTRGTEISQLRCRNKVQLRAESLLTHRCIDEPSP